VILFGAMSPKDDVRKGYRELWQALKIVAQSPLASRVLAAVFGNEASFSYDWPIPTVSLGYLKGDEALIDAYNCADVVIVPSLEDNLPNIALEAIACGIPVAAFDVGGMPDILVDGWNGRLVPEVDSERLGRALVGILADSRRLKAMSSNARDYAQQRFSLQGQAKAYQILYEQLIGNRRESIERSYAKGDCN